MTSNKKELKSGQIEEPLDSQPNVASRMQQQNDTDQDVLTAVNDETTQLNEIFF